MKNKNFLMGLAVGAICIAAIATGFYLVQSGFVSINLDSEKTNKKELSEAAFTADIQELVKVEQTFTGVRAFFVDLAQKDGGRYAFEVLKRAPLPPNTDLHLLGHAVGDELYKQEKFDGMQYCTHDFRNACSHSIVVGALLEKGLAVFDEVNEVCKLAPGGPGAYTMCFHGFGHGVLAFTDYEMPEAVALCKKVGTQQYNFEEESQCIGGIVMEMFGGINDPATWEEKKDKYLSITDPLRMCKADYMPENAKILCYSYITPFIFESAGALNGNPTPDIFAKAFTFCDEIENDNHRKSCYGGLGKEFIVLSQDRDIRKMEDTPDEKLKLTASWCTLAEKEEAEIACLLTVVDSLFWGGENDPEVSIRYCSLVEEGVPQRACFVHLFEITTYYQQDSAKRKTICDSVPSLYSNTCREMLL